MCLSLVRQRLVHDYYRSQGALLFDIAVIRKNACTFNQPESAIAQFAEFIARGLTEFVQGF
jgi:hypothetical protein